MPVEYADIASTRTVTPSAREAVASSCGRSSPIRGTMSKCNAPHPTANRNHASSNKPSDHRATKAHVRNSGEGTGVRSSMVCVSVCQEL